MDEYENLSGNVGYTEFIEPEEELDDYDEVDGEDLVEPEPEQLVHEFKPLKDQNELSIIYDILNKNEKTAILTYRVSQLVHGAPSTVDVPVEVTDMGTIAMMEYRQGKIPLIVRRVYPNPNPNQPPKVELVRGIPI